MDHKSETNHDFWVVWSGHQLMSYGWSGHQLMSYGQSCWQFNSTIAHCQKPLSWNMDLFQCPQNALRYLQCMYLYKSRLNFSIKTLNSLGSDWEIWEKWTKKRVSNFEKNQFFEDTYNLHLQKSHLKLGNLAKLVFWSISSYKDWSFAKMLSFFYMCQLYQTSQSNQVSQEFAKKI